jgi:hypothetical protein
MSTADSPPPNATSSTRRLIVLLIKHDALEDLWVTPCVCAATDEMDLFAEEMENVIAKGLPEAGRA